MEENNNNENNKKNICFENNCWKKCLVMTCAAFLGGFLAFYFVSDQMLHRYHKPYGFNHKKFEKRIFDDFDRMYREDIKAFDDAFNRINEDFIPKMKPPISKTPFFMMDSVKIKTEFDDGNYNIIIGLKPFQDNPDKINYKVHGNKLTVFGNSEIKKDNYINDVAFSQDFILPENSDIAKISKIKDGHKLIISIPIKD